MFHQFQIIRQFSLNLIINLNIFLIFIFDLQILLKLELHAQSELVTIKTFTNFPYKKSLKS